MLPYLHAAGLVQAAPGAAERASIEQLVPLIQERLVVLSEAPDLLRFFFQAPLAYDPALLVPKKLDPATARTVLDRAAQALRDLSDWSVEAIEARIRGLVEELGLKIGDAFMTLRVAATGSKVSPPLFETLHALGKDETLARLERAATTLETATTA